MCEGQCKQPLPMPPCQLWLQQRKLPMGAAAQTVAVAQRQSEQQPHRPHPLLQPSHG
jgi:hypothetical protein